MAVYFKFSAYIEDCDTILEKIARIDELIQALSDNMLDAAGNNDQMEYSLNDGQTIIKVINRGLKATEETIAMLERRRIKYSNRLTGRVLRLVDSKNLPGYGRSSRG